MKKHEWKRKARAAEQRAREWTTEAQGASQYARGLAADVERLRARVEEMQTHWRPIPIKHEWQPRDPQCLYCDDPRDAERHREAM